jgi:hypothetical protein
MRRGLRLVLPLLVLAAALALAGCFESSSPVDVTPYLKETPVAPGGTVAVPLFLNSTQSFKQDLGLRVGEMPQGWTYRLSVDQVALPGYKGRLVVVTFMAPQDAAPGARGFDVFAGDTRATVQLNVTAPGEPVPAGATVRATLAHLDRNGTILNATPTDAFSSGLKHHRGAGAGPMPSLLYLGEGEAPNGTTPVAGALRERLLGARVGEALLVETAETADPLRHEGPSDGARLLVRVDGVEPPAGGA